MQEASWHTLFPNVTLVHLLCFVCFMGFLVLPQAAPGTLTSALSALGRQLQEDRAFGPGCFKEDHLLRYVHETWMTFLSTYCSPPPPLFLWVFFHELSQARKNLWVFLKCVMLIFIETVLIIEMNVHRKPLMAASVLTLEVNSGVDIWSSESDDTSTLLAAHTPSLWVYGWALSHSVADSDHRFFFFPSAKLVDERH